MGNIARRGKDKAGIEDNKSACKANVIKSAFIKFNAFNQNNARIIKVLY